MADDSELPTKEEALEAVRLAQKQYNKVSWRLNDYRTYFREERDEAVRIAIQAGVSKKDIARVLVVSPQWLNKLLRGEAYRRTDD